MYFELGYSQWTSSTQYSPRGHHAVSSAVGASHAAARVPDGLEHAHIGVEYEDQGDGVDAYEQQSRILPALGIRIVYVQREADAVVPIEMLAEVVVGQERSGGQAKADAPHQQQTQYNSAKIDCSFE